MILRLEFALRAAAVRLPVVGNRRQRQVRVDVVLRAAFAQQVIRQIVHQGFP